MSDRFLEPRREAARVQKSVSTHLFDILLGFSTNRVNPKKPNCVVAS